MPGPSTWNRVAAPRRSPASVPQREVLQPGTAGDVPSVLQARKGEGRAGIGTRPLGTLLRQPCFLGHFISLSFYFLISKTKELDSVYLGISYFRVSRNTSLILYTFLSLSFGVLFCFAFTGSVVCTILISWVRLPVLSTCTRRQPPADTSPGTDVSPSSSSLRD